MLLKSRGDGHIVFLQWVEAGASNFPEATLIGQSSSALSEALSSSEMSDPTLDGYCQ